MARWPETMAILQGLTDLSQVGEVFECFDLRVVAALLFLSGEFGLVRRAVGRARVDQVDGCWGCSANNYEEVAHLSVCSSNFCIAC